MTEASAPADPLSILVHDLRNGLGTISCALAVMDAHRDDKATLQLAWEIATCQIGQMTRVLDQLLDQVHVIERRDCAAPDGAPTATGLPPTPPDP